MAERYKIYINQAEADAIGVKDGDVLNEGTMYSPIDVIVYKPLTPEDLENFELPRIRHND